MALNSCHMLNIEYRTKISCKYLPQMESDVL